VLNLKLVRLAAWGSLALVAIFTLAPIDFRPATTFPPTIERFVAFAAVGFVFAVAYPRQFWFAVAVAIGAALLLEVLQVLAPTRHGQLFDAAVKLAGGSAGLLLGLVMKRPLAVLAASIQGFVTSPRNLG